MCGICGIFHYRTGQRADEAAMRDALLEMNRQILHRGPDDGGTFVAGSVGLAMRRLSIIDIKNGPPAFIQRGRLDLDRVQRRDL